MRIALPIAAGELAMHFGHCAQFAMVDADIEKKEIEHREIIQSPPHQPGFIPFWLASHGVDLIITGRMGKQTQELFEANKIEVVTGDFSGRPQKIINDYLEGALDTGLNPCDY